MDKITCIYDDEVPDDRQFVFNGFDLRMVDSFDHAEVDNKEFTEGAAAAQSKSEKRKKMRFKRKQKIYRAGYVKGYADGQIYLKALISGLPTFSPPPEEKE